MGRKERQEGLTILWGGGGGDLGKTMGFDGATLR